MRPGRLHQGLRSKPPVGVPVSKRSPLVSPGKRDSRSPQGTHPAQIQHSGGSPSPLTLEHEEPTASLQSRKVSPGPGPQFGRSVRFCAARAASSGSTSDTGLGFPLYELHKQVHLSPLLGVRVWPPTEEGGGRKEAGDHRRRTLCSVWRKQGRVTSEGRRTTGST